MCCWVFFLCCWKIRCSRRFLLRETIERVDEVLSLGVSILQLVVEQLVEIVYWHLILSNPSAGLGRHERVLKK